MKKTHLMYTAILFVFIFLTGQGFAEEMKGENGQGQLMSINRVSEFIGQSVTNQEGEKLGEVNDIIFSNDGNIKYIILSREEGMEIGSELVPVPWDADHLRVQENTPILNMGRNEVENAPSFTLQEWERLDERDFQDEVHSYYGTENDRTAEMAEEPVLILITEAFASPEYLEQIVKNEQGEELGEISYIILSKGRGDEAELLPIPWIEENFRVQENTLILGMDKEQMEDAPSFTTEEWERFAEQDFQDEVHGYYDTQKDKNKDINRINAVLGQTIKSREGEELGEVKDIIFSNDGTINYIILSKGGGDDSLVPIPWQTENINVRENNIILSMNKEQMEDAPSFTTEEWERFAEQDFQNEVHGYYDTEKDKNKNNPGESGEKHGVRQNQEISRLSEVLGQTIRSREGEELGEVNDFIFNNDGNITYIIISKGGLDSEADLIPIPMHTEKINMQEDSIILDMSRQTLDEAPSFSTREWETLKEQGFQEKVHGYYNDESGKEER
jgi:uncharacterized protein YrrD